MMYVSVIVRLFAAISKLNYFEFRIENPGFSRMARKYVILSPEFKIYANRTTALKQHKHRNIAQVGKLRP